MPDSSIVIMGGYGSNNIINNEVWRSTDSGKTWTQIPAPRWTARGFATSHAMPDSSIVLIGGRGLLSDTNDVWRVPLAGSNDQNPVHSYTGSGPYTVTLSVSNSTGYTVMQKPGYVPTHLSNVVGFGNTRTISTVPAHIDYHSLGGPGAVRRTGQFESFIGTVVLPGNAWTQATNGAAVDRNGRFALWDSTGAVRYLTDKNYIAVSRVPDSP